MNDFGAILKQCRRIGVGLEQSSDPDDPRNTWTQKSLAEKVGLKSPDMIGRWESNRSRPSHDNFLDLRLALTRPNATEEEERLLRTLIDAYNYPSEVSTSAESADPEPNHSDLGATQDASGASDPFQRPEGPRTATVPGTKFDIYISYAQNDDEPTTLLPHGWVNEFVVSLETALKQRLGAATAPSIFFAKRDLGSNKSEADALVEVDHCACMVAICSRSYAQRDLTVLELERLGTRDGTDRRLFAIDILPLSEDEYPKRLKHKRRLPFYVKSAVSKNTAIPLSPTHAEFHNLVHDLAEQIRDQLLAMRAADQVSDAAQYVHDTAVGRKQVLLAQVTEDLEDSREELRRYLEQFGYRVLPRELYRQDGPTFYAQVEADLEKADLFVQLLGPTKGRCPPDLPRGYVQTQATLARESKKDVMHWRSASVDVASLSDADHRDLLTAETVMASGFEAFKSAVKERLDRETPKTSSNSGDKPLQMVFVNADAADLDYAKKVKDELVSHGLMASTSATLKPNLLKEHLVDCDALILLYGNASHVWADRNLRLFNKLRAKRERPPKVVAVLLGPPPEREEDLAIDMPGLRIIGDRTQWDSTQLSEVIQEMQNAKT